LDRELKYEAGGYSVSVNEKNFMEGNLLTHTQQCVLLKKDFSERTKIYDINRFGMFTKEEFEEALKKAGFKEIVFLGKSLLQITNSSKSLYCVARK